MTPDQIQTQLNILQSELDKLKQVKPDGMIGNSSDSPYVESTANYIPQPGEVVEVSSYDKIWYQKIFSQYRKDETEPYYCVTDSNEQSVVDDYRKGLKYSNTKWKLCRRLSGEIIEFGCDKANPDYTHLLPEGYEFCTEEQAEKWVKVEHATGETAIHNKEYQLGHTVLLPMNTFKPYYRPIRPIQYHVQVHEAVTIADDPIKVAEYYQPLFDLLHKEHNVIATQSELDEIIRTAGSLGNAEPNPYAVDWANAPEWADSHAYDKNEIGVFYGVEQGDSQYKPKWTASGLLLPAGLDWKLSKTVRPK